MDNVDINVIGPFETSVAAAKKWDDLCYASEHKVVMIHICLKLIYRIF